MELRKSEERHRRERRKNTRMKKKLEEEIRELKSRKDMTMDNIIIETNCRSSTFVVPPYLLAIYKVQDELFTDEVFRDGAAWEAYTYRYM